MTAISHRITIHAPQDQVFRALSTVEGLKSWFTPKIEGKVGKNQEAVFSFADEQPFAWKFIEVEPNSLVRWKCTEGPGAATGTSVTFRVSSKGVNQTVVECDHEGWPEAHSAFKTCNTFWGILLGQLKKYAETGQAETSLLNGISQKRTHATEAGGQTLKERAGNQRKAIAEFSNWALSFGGALHGIWPSRMPQCLISCALVFGLLAAALYFPSAQRVFGQDMHHCSGGTSLGDQRSVQDKISLAMSAGPDSVANAARIVDVEASGKMIVLREGHNGFTCMPAHGDTSPAMCADEAAMRWMADFEAHKPKPTNTVPGVMYMLAGATQRSDSEPYDTTSPLIKIGVHWMIMWPFDPKTTGLPTSHKPTGAYIMWAGSPYAHLHIMGRP
jgi:uncharacterized protein YndB with AHSA1/START domain